MVGAHELICWFVVGLMSWCLLWGEEDIYLVFRGEGESLVNLDWFSFAKE